MSAPAVHTPAPQAPVAAPDLFGADPALPPPWLEFSGVLKADAQVRSRPVGDGGRVLPVLCLELEAVGPSRHCLRAEQIYPEADHAQAEKTARTLRKGMQVRVQTSALNLRLYLPHVERIEVDGAPHPNHH